MNISKIYKTNKLIGYRLMVIIEIMLGDGSLEMISNYLKVLDYHYGILQPIQNI